MDGVICIPAALTADDIEWGERIFILVCFIVLAFADDKSICYTRLKIIYSAFWLRVLLHLAIEKGPPL